MFAFVRALARLLFYSLLWVALFAIPLAYIVLLIYNFEHVFALTFWFVFAVAVVYIGTQVDSRTRTFK
ncbi:hypothetical protein EI546_06565 [Aequorivita sp. H23M31]|uniref:Uncharacterized protein n=1 Tax=Aequorivita ciconiae TaxID=2494375 RepID=A0A410G2B9_9FLAO|nr:hypothetical protein [Aequorivita sp. H23M31]QAA81412.1 hypothetical protein EI546_06565 [Aequorivita sp. H23M31]